MLSEEQAIEKLKKIREDTVKANECGLSNNDFKEEIEVYDTVLNLITKSQKENEEKDKQIDLMAISILVKKIGDYPCGYKQDCIKSDKEYRDIHCKDCIKQYFETKAKKGE